jgi:uncharacterized membrane protein YgcG
MKTVFRCSLALLLILFWFGGTGGKTQADETDLLGNELQLDRAAGLDNEILDRILAAARRGQLRNEEAVRWLAQVRIASREKLPTAPLINKIEEGVSKGIDFLRIEAALGRMTDNLRFTSALTAGDSQDQPGRPPAGARRIMIRMSELLSAGMTQSEMQRLYHTWNPASPRQKVEAMTFYAVAKQAGLDPAEADRIASAGIEQNHFHGFPLDLAMMIKAAKANRIPSSEIVEHALRIIRGEETVIQAHRQMKISRMHPSPAREAMDTRGRTVTGGPGRGSGSGLSGGGAGGSSGHGAGGGGHGAGGRKGR